MIVLEILTVCETMYLMSFYSMNFPAPCAWYRLCFVPCCICCLIHEDSFVLRIFHNNLEFKQTNPHKLPNS